MGPRPRLIAPADLARFFVAVGLIPLLLVIDPPPWSFALTPAWSIPQLACIAVAGVALGWTSGRVGPGLAAVTLGTLVGLAVDLWWLAGFVTPFDQAFVTLLPGSEWRSSLVWAALSMLGAVSAGFLLGAMALRLIRDGPTRASRRPTGGEAVVIGLAVVGAPLLALGLASAAATSPLVVPDGAQIQTVLVSAEGIRVEPAVLRAGPTRFKCQFATDAAPEWARLIARAPGADDVPASFPPEDLSACGQQPGDVTWGTIADLPPGEYVWTQIEPAEIPRTISTSPVFVVER